MKVKCTHGDKVWIVEIYSKKDPISGKTYYWTFVPTEISKVGATGKTRKEQKEALDALMNVMGKIIADNTVWKGWKVEKTRRRNK